MSDSNVQVPDMGRNELEFRHLGEQATKPVKKVASLLITLLISGAFVFLFTDGSPAQGGSTLELLGKKGKHDNRIASNADQMIEEGRQTFRFDTFGDEAFWGDMLKLHQAIKGANLGGVGEGLTPRMALTLGLKVDVDALPNKLVKDLEKGRVDLDDPATTLALLKLDAVVGIKGVFQGETLSSVGISCALCHSTVDDSLVSGIGSRLDGWANRDLNVGEIVALAPDLVQYLLSL